MTDWPAAPPTDRTILIVADAPAFAAVEEAAALIRASTTRVDWADAASAIEAVEGMPAIAIEAEGVAATRLAEHLPAIAAAVEARELAVVAALSEEDIDLVAGALFGPQIQLLCAPTALDRVAALLVATRAGEIDPHTPLRESDRDRLRQLHEEIARIAEVLGRLSKQAGSAGDAVDDRRNSYDSGPGVDMADPQAIRQAIRARRLREGFFPAGLFEDPAWDMLLDLFAAELEGGRVSVSSLCIAAAVAPTTALRWIAKMTEAGLLQRVPDPQDRRRAFMALTDRARAGMRGYLGAVSRAGLTIA